MSNQKTTHSNNITEMTLFPLEEVEDLRENVSVSNEGSEKEEKKSNPRNLAPTFKRYDNRQIQWIYDIEALIPDHHVARVVDEMVEAIPDERLFSYYVGGGRASYHPKMMLKIILFGYSQKIYSCRGIETLARENIPAMWLAALQQPDFRTINEFRHVRMKDLMDELFETMILKLIDEKYITFENYFLDGTKIEANANKYSFVWKKSTENFEAKLREKITETLQFIQELSKQEMANDDQISEQNLEVVANQIEKKVEELTEKIEEEPDAKVRKELRKERT